jgi:hypothetical protein
MHGNIARPLGAPAPGRAKLREWLLVATLLFEPLMERTLPPGWAEHGIFRFEKVA